MSSSDAEATGSAADNSAESNKADDTTTDLRERGDSSSSSVKKASPKRWQPGQERRVHFASMPPALVVDEPLAEPPAVTPRPQEASSKNLPGYGTLTFKFELPPKPFVDKPPTDALIVAVQPNEAKVKNIAGYGTLSYKLGDCFKPPLLPTVPSLVEGVESQQPPDFDSLCCMSKEEARQAMVEFTARNSCYGSTCAKQMIIKEIHPAMSVKYTLESFYEARAAMMKEVPYRGGHVDGPKHGVPPLPWDVECHPDELFCNGIKLLQVPHTSEVMECHNCDNKGYVACYRCGGHGMVICGYCHATGLHMHYDKEGMMRKAECSHCKGSHQISCTCCHAEGRLVCTHCDGYGYVKTYALLQVTFSNLVSNHSIEETQMPASLVKEASFIPIYEQTLPQVAPANTFSVKDIAVASERLMTEHASSQQAFKRLLCQRQCIHTAQLAEMQYSWRGKDRTCWIYGKDNSVQAPDYPQKVCWGCTIS